MSEKEVTPQDKMREETQITIIFGPAIYINIKGGLCPTMESGWGVTPNQGDLKFEVVHLPL